MKTERILIVVLLVLVLALAYFALSGRKKQEVEEAKQMWHTNTVELWLTNTIEKWHTNNVELSGTVPAPQIITNEVIKEVPAKLTDLERRAALLGYRYMNAPAVPDGSSTLYKASPLAVDVQVHPGARAVPGQDVAALKKQVEEALKSKNIPVADKSPYHLKVDVSPTWMTDVPRVALVKLEMELREKSAAERGGDIIDYMGVSWNSSTSKLVRTAAGPGDMQTLVQEQVDKFCQEYQKAKEKEPAVQGQLPKIPENFLKGEH